MLSLFFQTPALGQSKFECNTAQSIKALMDEQHAEPELLEGRWSEAVTLSLLLKLDSKGLFFTQADLTGDLNELTRLEAVVKEGACDFLSSFNAFLTSRLQALDSAISAITYTELQAYTGQQLAKPKALGDYAVDQADLENRWLAHLKALVYRYKYLEGTDEGLEADNEAEIFADLLAQERCKLSKKLELLEDDEDFISRAFFNAITAAYDPHSSYHNYDFMELIMAMGSELQKKSFGFQLIENELGQIAIGKLLPGGPAWRSNQLYVGDILIKMEWSDGDEIDFKCTTLKKARLKLQVNTTPKAELTVLTRAGQQKRISLTMDKVQSTENAVRGYVLNGSKKLGYIALPDFYTSEGEDEEERGCARDVAREIIKLKRDKIEGLVLDLRNNGGGSLQEAVELIGIFIEEGPLALIKKGDKELPMRDRNRGAAYNGPLVVLVNGQSASASELVAATLQDYNRALIVGDTTFGKGVGQEFIGVGKFLGKSLTDMEEMKDLQPAMIRLTSARLYRLKGQSYQQQGVAPDIYIPELLTEAEEREADDPFSVTPNSIDWDTYFKKYPELPKGSLQAANDRRLSSQGFFKVKALSDSIIATNGQLTSLQPAAFLKLRALTSSLKKKTADLISNPKPFTADNHQFDKTIVNMDNRKKAVEQRTLQNIENNLYIRSAFLISADLIDSMQ